MLADGSDYYQLSLGSITGFDASTLPTTNITSLDQLGWSIGQLQDFLLNVNDINFPTEDWARKIDELITAHLNDFNNPHHITLDQIVGDFTQDVLGNIVPGTPPSTSPFFAYEASIPLPINDIYPATYSYTNLYSMNAGGTFEDHTQDVELLGTDHSTGRAGLPLFLPFTNTTPSNWATQSATPENTQIALGNLTNLSYPFSFYTVSETAGNNGPFGINLPCSTVLGTVYVTTFFVLPTSVNGSIIINQQGNSSDTATINLTSGTATTTTQAMAVDTYTYISGLVRVSISFTANSTSTSNYLTVSHINPGDTSPARAGQANRQILIIADPSTAATGINHPIIINQANSASTSPLALTLPAVNAPATMANLMMSLTLDVYPALPLDATVYDPILTFGNLQIRRDQFNFYVYVGNTSFFTSPIQNGLNILSLSYSQGTLIFKDLANPRQSMTGSFSPLSTANVVMGRFNGYLRSLAFYAGSDTTQCLEFLTNG